MKLNLTTSIAVCFLLFPLQANADGPPLRTVLDDAHAMGADFWVYNNLAEGFEKAKRTNKPLFVTFRCVPCQACESFDAEVASGSKAIERMARKSFVSVRQVEMKDVDLSQFQFDYDLSWSAMFLNADGTVYARYGTQSADGPDAYNSIEGLQTTMQRVLDLHSNYPNNKSELAAKRGADKKYPSALNLPGLQEPAKRKQATTRKNCIHCHMLHDAENRTAQASDDFSFDQLYRYPLPDNLGLSVDAQNGIRINKVTPGSPADEAGIKADEDITHVSGQAIASIADIQWALHNLPDKAQTISVKTSQREARLSVPAGWKKSDISWRSSMYSVAPIMRVWMPVLTDERRSQLKLPADVNGLEVKWINTGKPGGQSARKCGLRQKDIVVAMDGKPMQMTHRAFNMHLKMNYNVGDELPLTVLRNGKRIDLKIKLVE